MKELVRILANVFIGVILGFFCSKIIIFLISPSKRICYFNFLINK